MSPYTIKSQKALEIAAELAALRKQNAQRLEEKIFWTLDPNWWDPKNFGCCCDWSKHEICGVCVGTNRPEATPLGHPEPTNKPKPIEPADREYGCMDCRGFVSLRKAQSHHAWLCCYCAARRHEQSAQHTMQTNALHLKHKDCTPAAKSIQDIVLSVDDGRWDD